MERDDPNPEHDPTLRPGDPLGGQPPTDPEDPAAGEPPTRREQPAAGEPPTTEPPATEPPATEDPVDPAACEQLDAVANGSLDGTGDRQVVPSDGFFQAGAGAQAACLTPPAGTDFDVTLQQWTGVRWRTVAQAASAGVDGTEQLTFDGAAAFYRYVVSSTEGAGDYALQVGLP
jgi:hypothetical protein